jgi:hypothetical protein
VVEAMGGGCAATFGFTAVTGIDPAEPPIEDVTDEHETTRPTVRFLVVDDEVFVSSALGTLQLIGRFGVRSFGLFVFGGRLAGA